MIVKWGIGGLILGAVVGVFTGDIGMSMFIGGLAGIALRKWIFRNLWV